jgi:hypothetical protein
MLEKIFNKEEFDIDSLKKYTNENKIKQTKKLHKKIMYLINKEAKAGSYKLIISFKPREMCLIDFLRSRLEDDFFKVTETKFGIEIEWELDKEKYL